MTTARPAEVQSGAWVHENPLFGDAAHHDDQPQACSSHTYYTHRAWGDAVDGEQQVQWGTDGGGGTPPATATAASCRHAPLAPSAPCRWLLTTPSPSPTTGPQR